MAITKSDRSSLQWYDNLPISQYRLLYCIPIGFLLFFVLVLRVIWRPKATKPRFKLPEQNYGAVSTSVDISSEEESRKNPVKHVLHAGQVAGFYNTPWTRTFDFIFLVGMCLIFCGLVVVTCLYQPELWSNSEFWLFMIPKLLAMILVSCFGGLVCRCFCKLDEKGYVMTTPTSFFKVNYTRKLQYCAAYFIPLIVKPSPLCKCNGTLELLWSDFFTLIGFLVLIKPIRERFTIFMLQFNSLDRPEDRPHTLKWMVGGNVAPGLVILTFFRYIFNSTAQSNLVFIIILVVAVGDGLAEPVGIVWGKHKYGTTSCFSKRKYTRSLEGSACVFLSGMVFPALQYRDFVDPMQLWLTMAILPPVVAYAEAISPHTMDTPILMIVTGTLLYSLVHFF